MPDINIEGAELLLNLLYDLLCLVLPWDQVDESICAKPLEWSGKTLGRFMRFFGPVSSVFDIITFAYLFFVLCPAVCGGTFASLSGSGEQARFIILFQTGWFLESMWTQVLILHLLRTPCLPFIQSRPAAGVLAVTAAGLALFTALTFTPLFRRSDVIDPSPGPISHTLAPSCAFKALTIRSRAEAE